MAARAARRPSGSARYTARKQPLAGEMLDPDEVAHAAVYFLSDESRAVTGQLLKVDGGWSVVSVGAGAAAVTFVRTVLGDIDPRQHRRHVRPRAPGHRRRAAGRALAGLPPRRRRPADDRAGRRHAGGPPDGGRHDADRVRPRTRRSSPSCRGGPASRSCAATGPPPRAVLRRRRTGALTRDARTSWPTCSSPTSRRASTSGLRSRPIVRPDGVPRRHRQGRRQRGRPVGRATCRSSAAAAAPTGGPASRSTPTARRHRRARSSSAS